MNTKKQIYLKLFTSTFCLSACTFGGGFVIVPLMKKQFTDILHWIDEEEMLNLVAIAQSSPGPVAVNASILIGYRVAGIGGALLTILGTVLPPFLILSIISLCYTAFRDNILIAALLKGMQAGIAAVIVDVVLSLGHTVAKGPDYLSLAVMLVAFICNFFLKINLIYILIVCAGIGAWRNLRANKSSEEA